MSISSPSREATLKPEWILPAKGSVMKRNKPKARTETFAEQRALILGPFVGYLEDGEDIDGLIDYMRHCGIDLQAIDTSKPNGVVEAILNHYRVGTRRFDIERAANDLLRLPAIQARIAELKRERAASKPT